MTTDTRPVRAGEEIDSIRLETYLCDSEFGEGGGLVVEQFPAGSSNLTYLIRFGDLEYVLRRPPFGNTVKSAHDMRREFDVLSKLSAVYPPAPKPLLFCDDETVIGSEFYIMERRRGLIIRGILPESISVRPKPPELSIIRQPVTDAPQANETKSATTSLPPAQGGGSERSDLRTKVCESFVKTLADLHTLDYKAAGLADLGRPVGYVRRQVEGWSKRYFAAKTNEQPEIEKTIVWLNENMPADSGGTLVHNDYKFDNVMLDPDDLTKLTAVLDWEMVTVGDPLMDFGTTLGYWMSPDAGEDMLNMPFNPRVLMENITRRELVEMYADASGRDISNILYYYVFGTFKIAVIGQQIYVRYVKGFTSDKRFANFDRFVYALGRLAERAIENGTI